MFTLPMFINCFYFYWSVSTTTNLNTEVIIGVNSNAQSAMWNCPIQNAWGDLVEDFLALHGLN